LVGIDLSPLCDGQVIEVFVADARALKIDCVPQPHFHVDPDGRNLLRRIPSEPASVWAAQAIAHQLPRLLRDARYEDAAAQCEREDVRASLEQAAASLTPSDR
jgi:hypothetical protein